MDLINEIGFVDAYSFKYSARPGTPAAVLPEQVPEDVKTLRLQVLQEKLNAGKATFNQHAIGTVMPVLLEGPGRHPGQLVGRSPYMQAVHVSASDDWVGQIADVKIDAAHPNSLAASLMGEQTRRANA